MKATTLSISAKCADLCFIEVQDAQGNVLATQSQGYVPKFFPGEHYGDYVMLDIDIATGRITNWKPPTEEVLMSQLEIDPE